MNDLFDIIRADLSLVEEKLHEGTADMFSPLATGMAHLLDSGGKRLRPALVLLASRFHNGASVDKIVALAAAVETLHTATLVHDDLIDGARVRRGQRTLSATWSKASTVLAGDYLFARAAHFAAETDNTRVVSIFAATLMTICDGELRQLFGAFDFDQDLDSYYVRIFSKTASLFAGATEAAAVLVGAQPNVIAALKDYGRYLGMSFQIQDDILDFTGDERLMGKPTGSDLRQGIVTLPVYYFLRENPGREEWKAALQGLGAARDASVERFVEEVRHSAAIDRCRSESEDLARRAQESLSSLPDTVEKERLLRLVSELLQRKK